MKRAPAPGPAPQILIPQFPGRFPAKKSRERERERGRGRRRHLREGERSAGSGGCIVRQVQAIFFVFSGRFPRAQFCSFLWHSISRSAKPLYFLLPGAPGAAGNACRPNPLRRKHGFRRAHLPMICDCAARRRGRAGNALCFPITRGAGINTWQPRSRRPGNLENQARGSALWLGGGRAAITMRARELQPAPFVMAEAL